MYSSILFWSLWGTSAVFVAIFGCLILWNYRMALRLSDAGQPLATPMVSLLIPARNEADNLPHTLPLCLESDYPSFEVIVLDDQSTDGTSEILASLSAEHAQLRVISGAPLPPGHNGKNWACEQLSKAAKGDILIFCDADVSVGGKAMSDTVSWLLRSGAGLVTGLPHQRLVTWAEQAVVPFVMHLATLGFVSIYRAFISPRPAFTVANGQWMAFTRRCYDAIGGHAAVKAAIVEDMVLAKRVKTHGFRTLPAIAFEGLSVRMYRDIGGVWQGYAKNLFGIMGYQLWVVAIVLVVFLGGMVLPWLMAFVYGGVWWALCLGLLAARIFLASWARHPWRSVVLHPVGAVMLLGLLFDSLRRYYTNDITWKSRTLQRPDEDVEASETEALATSEVGPTSKAGAIA